jgi:hypothetical protein
VPPASVPFACAANSHTMTPPTWENTPHLGARSRYGPTPTERGADRPLPATAPPAQEQPWPSTPDRGERPSPAPAPLDRAGSSTSTLATLPEVLTISEAAAILRVGRNQLWSVPVETIVGHKHTGDSGSNPAKGAGTDPRQIRNSGSHLATVAKDPDLFPGVPPVVS